ncbi:MAG TPA: CPBP family glutamic-type intramembrane protease [Spirochaetia bacterium]|nr:CPBP family glutamic-type intramembrane protease [Spirochaetia bacterium]
MSSIREIGSDRPSINLIISLTYAGLAMVLFTYLAPPVLTPSMAAAIPLLGTLPGDLPGYVSRFLASFLLLGVGPIVLARIFGWNRSYLGIANSRGFLKTGLFFILLAAFLLVGFTSAYSKGLSSFYPYSHTLVVWSTSVSGWYFVLHVVLYFVFYYVPWELFFRGFLILPFLIAYERSTAAGPTPPDSGITRAGFVLVIASFQIIPSALLHFGHPFSEMATAVLFGLVAAWLVCRTRSVLPGLFLHAAIGIALDTGILFRKLGVFPALPWLS